MHSYKFVLSWYHYACISARLDRIVLSQAIYHGMEHIYNKQLLVAKF